MMDNNYDRMSLDDLRRYVLTHREDERVFSIYIDRSVASGRMITIDLSSHSWEETLERQIQKTFSVEDEPDKL